MQNELIIRPYRPSDEYKILDLYNAVFGKLIDIAEWKWRYLENPYGGPNIVLMWDDELLVGHYAVAPINIDINGTTFKAALSLDTMTHPSYQGQGIFTRLADNLYGILMKSETSLVYGFPNKNSHYGFINKLHWIDIAAIPTLCLDFRIEGEKNEGISIKKITTFTEDVDSLFQKTIKASRFNVEKSSKYLNWHFYSRPYRNYAALGAYINDTLQGYCIYKLYNYENKTIGDIIDITYVRNIEVFRSLIVSVSHDLFNQGSDMVDIWMNENAEYYKILTEMGFVRRPPMTNFGALILNKALNHSGLTEWSNWNIQMGDSDIY